MAKRTFAMPEIQTPSQALSDESLHSIISVTAHTMSIVRKSNRLQGDHTFWDRMESTREEMESDWSDACIFWALKLLNGSICINEIQPASTWRFKQVWLTKMKEAIAYFLWNELKRCRTPDDPEADYYEACERIRDKLIGDTKLPPKDFEGIKAHLVEKYLTTGLTIDESKSDTKELIGTKASRIWQSTGQNDDARNWLIAKMYTKMFYENIIPAVVDDNSENVLAVLKAFQFSEAPENRYEIINCFELLLAVYFLDPSTIEKIWDWSAEQPSLGSATAIEQVKLCPTQFKIPADCLNFFEIRRGTDTTESVGFCFVGAMSKSQRDGLIDSLQSKEHRSAIEKLFEKSHIITKIQTL
jgi:hypothetical protein